jgi:SAM-dependent methyltransferase
VGADLMAGELTYRLDPRWTSVDEIIRTFGFGAVRLDLGCGFAKPKGFIGLDSLVGERIQVKKPDSGPDVIMDLDLHPLPFPDNSCAEVRSSHFLEHSNRLDHIIDEVFRVLVPGGLFRFAVPYANSAEGLYPGHSLFLTERWFHENVVFQEYFAIVDEKYDESEAWKKLPWIVRRVIPFSFARTFLFNVCWQMIISARSRKTA